MREIIVVEGGEELRERLLLLSKGIGPEIGGEAMLEAAAPMQEVATRLAPVEKGPAYRVMGLLKASIELGAAAPDFGGMTVGIVVQKRAWYWRFPELGTRLQPAQGFLRRAYEQEKEATVRRYAQRLRAKISELLSGRLE